MKLDYDRNLRTTQAAKILFTETGMFMMNTGRKLFFLKPLRWLHDQVFTFFRSLATFIKCKGNVWANSVFLLLLFPIEHILQSSLHEKEEKCYAHDYPVFSTFSHLQINCQLVEILL